MLLPAAFIATEGFLGKLAGVHWPLLGCAVALHGVKLAVVSRAWANILAAVYPTAGRRWRSVLGAYAASGALRTLAPARTGDALRLHLVKRSLPGADYGTLAGTLAAEGLFGAVAGVLLIGLALGLGLVPGVEPQRGLAAFGWVVANPLWAVLGLAGSALIVAYALRRLRPRLRALARSFAHGMAILADRRAYVRRVMPWQVLDLGLRLGALSCFLLAFGLAGSPEQTLAVRASQAASGFVAVAPSGLGAEQALSVVVLAPEPPSESLAFSLGMRTSMMATDIALAAIAAALVAALLLWRRRARGAGLLDEDAQLGLGHQLDEAQVHDDRHVGEREVALAHLEVVHGPAAGVEARP